jgi:hypothetical protein
MTLTAWVETSAAWVGFLMRELGLVPP